MISDLVRRGGSHTLAINRNPPRHRNSVNNLMPLGYVADVDAWMSGKNFFYIRYMRYVYVPIWEHWAGRVTFF